MLEVENWIFRQNGYVFPMLANGLFALKIIFSEVAGECITQMHTPAKTSHQQRKMICLVFPLKRRFLMLSV